MPAVSYTTSWDTICLYGIERYGGNLAAYVPSSVAIASGIPKLLLAIFIFLFGLAVRNMLKVK